MNIKMRIKQWLRDFLHPIVWDDLGLRVIKRELDDTWQVVQDLKYQVRKLIEGKEVMFNDSDKGQTQYCEECQKRVEKCEKLKKAIKEIKKGAVYGSVNSKHFLHDIFEEIIKICNESEEN